MREFVAVREIRSADEFVSEMSRTEEAAALFGNYVHMFNSRSLQGASFPEPRTIAFSPDDDFIMAFNGGGNSVEMMRLNRDGRFLNSSTPTSTAPPPRSSPRSTPRNVWPATEETRGPIGKPTTCGLGCTGARTTS